MNRLHEVIRNGVMVGGLLTAAGSAVDAVRTERLHDTQAAAMRQIVTGLASQYGVHNECTYSPFTQMPICYLTAPDVSVEKQNVIVSAYRDEVQRRTSEVPKDPFAQRRYTRDAVLGLAGVSAASLSRVRRRRR